MPSWKDVDYSENCGPIMGTNHCEERVSEYKRGDLKFGHTAGMHRLNTDTKDVLALHQAYQYSELYAW